ncbi:MAG: glycosyltransferase [Micrococcales bacterium]|nr:glycosyltransferase [Micrococcales bacterium]
MDRDSHAELLILVLSDITRDPRVRKQVDLFAERFAVTTCSFGAAPDGVAEHVSLGAEARGWPNDLGGLALRRHDHVYWRLPGVNAAREALRGRSFDAVIANDLNTVPLATTVRSRGGFHADLHEYAPAEKDNELPWRLLVAPYQRYLLRRYATLAASATTVSQGIADAYRRHFGLDCALVPNAAPYQDRTPGPVHTPMRAIFTGTAQAARHIDLMIEAMRHVPTGLTLDLYLMPNEPAYLASLQAAADRVPSVRILSPVPFAELMDTVASYDIALAFQRPTTFNIRYAAPNKFFEAVQARTAVVVGPAPELESIVRRHGFGVVTADFTAEALAETLRGLTPARVATLKAAADSAAYGLSAEQSMGPWVSAVEAMMLTARR